MAESFSLSQNQTRKMVYVEIRSVWEKLRLFKVQLNPLASNPRQIRTNFAGS